MHHGQHAHHGDRGGDELGDSLVQALAQGVHVVGDAREGVAGGVLLEVAEGHALDLAGDGIAQAVAGLLGDVAHDPRLHPGASGRGQVEPERDRQDAADGGVVDGTGTRRRGHGAVEEHGGGLGEHLGPHDGEHGGSDGEQEHEGETALELPHEGEHAAQGGLEVQGLLAAHHAPGRPMAATGTPSGTGHETGMAAHRAPPSRHEASGTAEGESACDAATAAEGADGSGATVAARMSGAIPTAASSASESWERAISR